MHFLFAVVLALMPAAAFAQTSADSLQRALEALAAGKPDLAYERLVIAAATVSQSLPFSVHRAVLTNGPAVGFAMDEPRETNLYAAGEDIDVYLEPRGYMYNERDGRFEFGFRVDLVVMDQLGAVLGGQNNLGSWRYSSRQHNLESFLTLTISLNDIPTGNYVMELRVHDLSAGDVTAVTQIPIEITG